MCVFVGSVTVQASVSWHASVTIPLYSLFLACNMARSVNSGYCAISVLYSNPVLRELFRVYIKSTHLFDSGGFAECALSL